MEQILAQFTDTDLIKLPIKSVDGISCEVYLKKSQQKNLLDDSIKEVFHLEIETWKNTHTFMDDMCEHNYYYAKIDLNELKSTLDGLKFNRLTSKFTSKPIIDWSFLESDTIKLKYDNCSVCMEVTTDKTDCGHVLCVPCYDKIKMDEDGTPCPLCRELLLLLRI